MFALQSSLGYMLYVTVNQVLIPWYCSFTDYNFTCAYSATTLTSWHLLVTFCSLHVALWLKFFEHKPFDSRAVMGFGILNGISIGLLNLSLGFNSVGFYQVNSSFPFKFWLTSFPYPIFILKHSCEIVWNLLLWMITFRASFFFWIK